MVSKGAVISNSYFGLAIVFLDYNEHLTLAPLFLGMVFNSLQCAVKEIVLWSGSNPLWFVVL